MGMLINPYRFAGASAGFSPTSIANLEVWLDASDTSTLYDATTGGNLVTNGNIVRRIQDKSGNGRHFTQSVTTTTQVGIRVDSGLNGKTTLESQSGQTTLRGYDSTFTLTLSAQTVIMIYNFTGSSGNSAARWFTQMNSSSLDGSQMTNSLVPLYGGGTTNAFTVYANGATRASISTGTTGTWKRRRTVVDSTTITHLWGSTSASYTYTQPSVEYTRFAMLGRTGATGFSFPYKFAELLMYSRALTSTELSDIDTYITNKWGSGLV
jgi:hypothetical protein